MRTLSLIIDKMRSRLSGPKQLSVVSSGTPNESSSPRTDSSPEVRESSKEYASMICPELFIVHSLPKVGGSTIALTLMANFGSAYVAHVHCLTDDGCRIWRAALPRYQRSFRDAVDQHLYRARKAAMLLEAGATLFPRTQKRAIICGVREPISWALSLYFETFSGLSGDEYEKISVESVADFVREVLADDRADLGLPFLSPERWLRTEFFHAHKFDIFAEDFDFEKGYQIYDTETAPILIIRQESLSKLTESLFSLLGYPAELIEPMNSNRAETKNYSGVYENIRKALKFDREWLRSIYAGAYSRKFYSESECDLFTERWARQPISAAA